MKRTRAGCPQCLGLNILVKMISHPVLCRKRSLTVELTARDRHTYLTRINDLVPKFATVEAERQNGLN